MKRIVHTANTSHGLTIIAIGPLTNVAAAVSTSTRSPRCSPSACSRNSTANQSPTPTASGCDSITVVSRPNTEATPQSASSRRRRLTPGSVATW